MKIGKAYLVFLFVILFESGALFKENETPDCKDVKMFLDAVEKSLKYTNGIKTDDDIGFGLLYVRENLERIIRFMRINHQEQPDILKRVNKLKAKVKLQLLQRRFTLIGPLFDSLMIVPITKEFRYNINAFNQKPIPTIQEQFPSIKEYMKAVGSSENSQNISNVHYCISSILQNNKHKRKYKKTYCKIDRFCQRFIMTGPNFGYGLTRRLLSLMIPNSQKCYLLSPEGDQKLTHMFCSAIFSEAMYMSNNNNLIYDLLMEQSILCSALGYTHFMNRYWLSKALSLQEDNGCYRNPQAKEYFIPNLFQGFGKNEVIRKTAKDMKPQYTINSTLITYDKTCSSHFTSVTMAMASATARYSVEKCLGKYRFASDRNLINFKTKHTQFIEPLVLPTISTAYIPSNVTKAANVSMAANASKA